ncbi:tetratricopeptide repeat protein [Nitratireductor mangrovi]|uniref:Tetratricopeptide repeat protein n=1 Tax=Nitratireductor mangrovi TaxID=2599600 RepID=A0A5B8KV07_9HYPH|nr:tetratricopeptide repeat protein [Nitratireductor mangrovi]QDY99339.1 tetratricopeptide repeat protein [Nitratireductor mangrovi]
MSESGKSLSAAAARTRAAITRLREFLSLPRLETWSSTLRTVSLNLLFLVAVIVVLPILVGQFRRDQVIVEPIGVPGVMADQGITPDVAASRLWDGLQDVVRASRTSKASIAAIPDSRKVEFSFPDSGFSIESLIFHIRRLFNAYETRIAGEFTCAEPGCAREGLRLRLRVIRDGVEIIDLPPLADTPERDYFANAASGVLAVLDPFVAIAASAEREPRRATILARRLIRSRHPDAHWAHNLVGNIRAAAGDHTGAMEEYRAALALEPGFLVAHANLADSLRLTGDRDGARREYATVARASPGHVSALVGFAEIALSENDVEGAVRHLLAAAESDPLSPRHLARAGQIEMEAGRREEGEHLLRRALEIDPGYLPAFAFLAAAHVADGDMEGAEPIYRDAADYAPDDSDAQAAHGRILFLLDRFDAALDRFQRAAALAPDDADYRLQAGRILQALGRHEEALAVLGEAMRLAPNRAEIHMALGDSYRDTGSKAEAIAAYRKFLELDQNSLMRPVAERFIALLSG